MIIKPHGGRLVSRIISDEGAIEKLDDDSSSMPRITLNARELCDLEMIATGAMSPLEGFMTREDYENVLERMRLKTGLPWSLPVVLSLKAGEADAVKEGSTVALYDPEDRFLGVLFVEDKFTMDKQQEAEQVLKTTDDAHPGVKYLQSIGDTYVGGPIEVAHRPVYEEFNNFRLDPKETRVLFKNKGWQRIAAFQTRNPIHRAHEYLQKCALEMVDALLIHPLMGETKKGDISGEVRLECYLALLNAYYPTDRVVLSIFPAAMRYAGPREAIFHALVRKNYGCSHFIVGRDHAGVGSYYGTYDAQKIFDEFEPEELGVTPIFFDHAFFCKVCGNMASSKTCPHGKEDRVFLSGTKVREMLGRGELPPAEFTRPEVAQILLEDAQQQAKESAAQ
jgi:sulfate adenylyltransferase